MIPQVAVAVGITGTSVLQDVDPLSKNVSAEEGGPVLGHAPSSVAERVRTSATEPAELYGVVTGRSKI